MLPKLVKKLRTTSNLIFFVNQCNYYLFVLLIVFALLSARFNFKRGKINKRKEKCSNPRS